MLHWAREVVLVDSFSTDETLEIARSFGNTRVVQRRLDQFDAQWAFGLASIPNAEWVLALDADYVLTPELVSEIAALAPEPEVSGYRTRFRYCMDGMPLRGSLYPASTVLF